ncbi:unnamed protein product [Pleuronectes platessa]|uniref:Uncharacterized protein n=1 Tax=Pleuronectes platessa TaxID=8262 RepID=A0A9N7V5C5_PLEPL|nr:unnamed protein product [Pleuronectes platessa]
MSQLYTEPSGREAVGQLIATVLLQTDRQTDRDRQTQLFDTLVHNSESEKVCWVMAALRVFLPLAICLLLGHQTFAKNDAPCQKSNRNNGFNTFVKRHIRAGLPNTLDQNEWERYIKNNGGCDRPTQSFLHPADLDRVKAVCTKAGGKTFKENLCISNQPFTFVTVRSQQGTCGIRNIQSEKVCWVMAALRVFLALTICLLLGHQTFAQNDAPCQKSKWNNEFNTFEERHISAGLPNTRDRNDWERELDRVKAVCTDAGGKTYMRNLCISNQPFTFFTVRIKEGTCSIRSISRENKHLILACRKAVRQLIATVLLQTDRQTEELCQTQLFDTLVHKSESEKVCWVMAALRGFLPFAISLLLGHQTFAINDAPCQPSQWNNSFNTFVKHHIRAGWPSVDNLTGWENYIRNNGSCDRPTQSFLQPDELDRVKAVCTKAGGKIYEKNMCISNQNFTFVTVRIESGTCVIRNVCWVMAALRVFLPLTICILLGHQTFATNDVPCQKSQWNNAFNTFVKRHIRAGLPNTLDQNEWENYIRNNNDCDRPTQSFLRHEELDRVNAMCTKEGGKIYEKNMCMSNQNFTFVTIHVTTPEGRPGLDIDTEEKDTVRPGSFSCMPSHSLSTGFLRGLKATDNDFQELAIEESQCQVHIWDYRGYWGERILLVVIRMIK